MVNFLSTDSLLLAYVTSIPVFNFPIEETWEITKHFLCLLSWCYDMVAILNYKEPLSSPRCIDRQPYIGDKILLPRIPRPILVASPSNICILSAYRLPFGCIWHLYVLAGSGRGETDLEDS